MKRILLLFGAITGIFSATAQPQLYFNFLTHNEETGQWNNASYYATNRLRCIALANYFQANGITWNMQSDWVYLTNVLIQETPQMMQSTNNKNILRWMYEDKGVEMDPHGHETQYIYPDLVKLMDSIGLPESKVIGGSIYNDYNGINLWTNLINGQYGAVFPSRFWQPQYLMGGGTPNHVADLKYYGFWNPTDTDNYLVHNPGSPLHHIGTGCEIKIKDTSTVSYIMGQVWDAVNNVQNNYPANGIYMQAIFFEQGDMNMMNFYNKVIQIADSVNAIVNSGQAGWRTFKQHYTYWETTYNQQVFQWECGQMMTGENDIQSSVEIKLFPNPAASTMQIDLGDVSLHPGAELKIYDMVGRIITDERLKSANTQLNVAAFAAGMYMLEVRNGKDTYRQKFLKE